MSGDGTLSMERGRNMKRNTAAWVAIASVAGLAGLPAQAQEGVAIKNLLGSIGVIAPEKDAIHYRERAPLVLPPRSELREPVTESFAANNPQWPNDPDVAARRRRAAAERIPVTQSEVRRMSENNPRLTVEEMRQGRSADPTAPAAPVVRTDRVWMSPTEMAAGRKTATADDDTPVVRRTLTDPPNVMRQSARGGTLTATSATPRVDQQALDANPMNWLTRQFRSSDDD